MKKVSDGTYSESSYSELYRLYRRVEDVARSLEKRRKNATANNIPIIDNFDRWGSWELKNPAPFLFYGNSQHPNGAVYSDFAQSIASQLLGTVGH
jgi:hypothetical protein